MKKKIAILFAVIAGLIAFPAFAQPQPKGCEGPAELCKQILDLNKKLAEQKEVTARSTAEVDKKVAEAKEEKEKEKEESTAKIIAFAAVLAAALKGFLSLLRTWKPYFKTVKGLAWLKVITVVVGLAAFLATNVGFGIPWWQSLILSAGGPGAMAFHDLLGLIPVIRGKKTDLPPDSEAPDPPDEAESQA